MPLHDSFKSSGGNARLSALSKMSSVPTVEDLTFALAQAQKARKRPIVLVWRTAEVPAGFSLTVTCGPDPDLPAWHLQFGDEAPKDMWTHASTDTTLIQGLLVAEHESAMNNLAMAQATAHATQQMQSEKKPLPQWQKPASKIASNELAELPQQATPSSSSQWQRPFAEQSGANEQYQTGGNARLNSATPQQAQPPHQASSSQWQSGQHEAQPAAAQLGTAGSGATRTLPAPIDLDRGAVDSIYQLITNPETGLITHSAFLFFFLREFRQFQKCGAPFSMVQFELLYNANGFLNPLPAEALRQAVQRMKNICRPLDWVAHYETTEYAILMPHTKRQEAHSIASTLCQSLYAEALAPALQPALLVLSCGVVSFPEDCEHPGVLLAAAKEAKEQAKLSMQPVVLFSDC